jgi:hypothetical protein
MKRAMLVILSLNLCISVFADNPLIGKWKMIPTFGGGASIWELYPDMTGQFRSSYGDEGDLIYELNEEESILKIGPTEKFEEESLTIYYEMDDQGEFWLGFLSNDDQRLEMLGIQDENIEKGELTRLEEELLDTLKNTAFLVGVKEE